MPAVYDARLVAGQEPPLPFEPIVSSDPAPPPLVDSARPDGARPALPSRWLDLAVLAALLVVAATAGYALWCGTPLIWDGSYQLAETLMAGEPYAYLSRFHTRIVWRPVVWATRWTDDPRVLQAVYGAPFLLAPVAGLGVSWWFARRHQPGLVAWAALGILATPLPGQVFVINDSVFQQHLFWPVFVGLLVPLTRPMKTVWYALAVFQFAHQVGLVLLAGAAGATCLLALVSRHPADRRRLRRAAALAVLLTAAMGWKVWLTSVPGTPYYDSFAAAEATWQVAQWRWWRAVSGLPWRGLKWVYLAAGLLCLHAWFVGLRWRRLAGSAAALAGVALLAAAAAWVEWAASPRLWAGAIDYRRWLVPLTGPAFMLVFVEVAWRARTGSGPARTTTTPGLSGPDSGPRRVHPERVLPAATPPAVLAVRAAAVLLLAGLFAAVLGRQSRDLKAMTDRLQAELAASPTATVSVGPDHWIHGSPLDHWPLSWHMLVLQGKRPTMWLVSTEVTAEHLRWLDGCRPRLPVSQFTAQDPRPGPTGWFDLRDLTATAAAEWAETRRAAGVD